MTAGRVAPCGATWRPMGGPIRGSPAVILLFALFGIGWIVVGYAGIRSSTRLATSSGGHGRTVSEG